MNKYDNLEYRIQSNLFESFAKDFASARNGEIFSSLANSLRQVIGKRWFESYRESIKDKRVYLLSFEYSIGNQLVNILLKLDLLEEAKSLLNDKGIDFEDIKDNDIEFALGFGDLGEVSDTILELLTNKKEDFYAYGLRYRRGMLKQEIVAGEQIEKPDDWKVNKNPWEHEKGFSHFVHFKDLSVKAIPYDMPIISNDGNHVNTLRLWKSFSINDIDFKMFSEGKILKSYNEINRANSIVEFLYPSENSREGKKLRLMQEYFFASSCIQDIIKKYKKYNSNDISKISDFVRIQIHDIHPVLAPLVFIDIAMGKYGLSFEEALDIAKRIFIYFHLSFLPESFAKLDLDLLSEVCPNILDIIYKFDKYVKDELLAVDKEFNFPLLIIQDGKLDVINVIYYISNKIITVNNAHIELIKKKYLKDHYTFYKDKIFNLDFPFDAKQYLKEVYYYYGIKNNNFEKLSSKDYKKIKYDSKNRLLDYLEIDKRLINIDSAFVSHLGVFHEYKRQLLSVLGVALQYYRLKKNPNLDIPERTYFFGGKSYPNYYVAKETIKFINALANQINNDLFIKDKIKIVFIENYNLTKSYITLPATDIYEKVEMISMQSDDFGIEKSILSGAAIITTNSYIEGDELLNNKLKSYKFGKGRNEVIFDNSYNLYEYLNQNKEIEELFNFYKTLSKDTFPYDITKIYNSIYYFNDEYHIIKDLYEYVEKLEEAINDYTEDHIWYNNLLHNANTLLSINEDIYIEKYIKILE